MSELDLLRSFAASSRSRADFGVPFLKCDGHDGAWKAGKNASAMDGRRLVADVLDIMHGHQKFENKKPIYALGRVADRFEPQRSALGDSDEARWVDGKDPWAAVVLLPMWDPETREPFLFTSANQGGRDGVSTLVDAFLDNCQTRPKDNRKLPLVELSSDSYTNTQGKQIFRFLRSPTGSNVLPPCGESCRRRSRCWN